MTIDLAGNHDFAWKWRLCEIMKFILVMNVTLCAKNSIGTRVRKIAYFLKNCRNFKNWSVCKWKLKQKKTRKIAYFLNHKRASHLKTRYQPKPLPAETPHSPSRMIGLDQSSPNWISPLSMTNACCWRTVEVYLYRTDLCHYQQHRLPDTKNQTLNLQVQRHNNTFLYP